MWRRYAGLHSFANEPANHCPCVDPPDHASLIFELIMQSRNVNGSTLATEQRSGAEIFLQGLLSVTEVQGNSSLLKLAVPLGVRQSAAQNFKQKKSMIVDGASSVD